MRYQLLAGPCHPRGPPFTSKKGYTTKQCGRALRPRETSIIQAFPTGCLKKRYASKCLVKKMHLLFRKYTKVLDETQRRVTSMSGGVRTFDLPSRVRKISLTSIL